MPSASCFFPYALPLKLALCRLLLGQDRVQEAVPHLEEAERLGSAEAARNLAVVHARCGNYAQTLTYCDRALELAPENAEAVDHMGELRRLIEGLQAQAAAPGTGAGEES